MDSTPVSLLDRVRRLGAEDAWEQFVDLYTPVLYAWSRRLGLDTEDAADLVQDIFLLLVEKLPEFVYDRRHSFRAWLKTLLVNKWRDRVRRQAAGPHTVSVDQLDQMPDESLDSFGELEYRQVLVARALRLMQTDFQPTTWKACWELAVAGRPAEEIARELGITPNAVYVAKSKVIRRLRQELQGLLD
jgi:RNA polymerase sigma-70 factor (ECF subfamily)